MKKRARLLVLVVFLTVTLTITFKQDTSASFVQPVDGYDEKTTLDADYIIIGNVIEAQPGEIIGHDYFFRLNTVAVEVIIKGNNDLKGSQIKVWIPPYPEMPLPPSPVDPCEIGARGIFYLKQNTDGTYVSTVQWFGETSAILEYPPNKCQYPPPQISGYNIIRRIYCILNTLKEKSLPGMVPPPDAEMSLKELTTLSDFIIIGTIDKEEDKYNLTSTRVIENYATFHVSLEKAIKRASIMKEIYIQRDIGPLDKLDEWIWDVPSFGVKDRVILFLKYDKKSYSVVGGRQGILYLKSNWMKTNGTEEELTGKILEIMRNNNLPVVLPLKEQLNYPPSTPVWMGASGLATLYLLLIGAIDWMAIRRRRREKPPLITEKGWNIIDWFYTIIMILSLALAIYTIAFTSNLWWFGLIILVFFWGFTLPLAIKRISVRISRTQPPA